MSIPAEEYLQRQRYQPVSRRRRRRCLLFATWSWLPKHEAVAIDSRRLPDEPQWWHLARGQRWVRISVSLSFFGLSWLHFGWRGLSPSLDSWRFSCQTSIFNNEHDRQQTPSINLLRSCQHQLQTTAPSMTPSSLPLLHRTATRLDKSACCSTALILPALENPKTPTQKNITTRQNTPPQHNNVRIHYPRRTPSGYTMQASLVEQHTGAQNARDTATYYRKQRSGWSY
jgi:hypothetical protein